MEYRIIDENGKIVAWIDSDNDEQIVRNGYVLEVAEHLPAMEVDGDIVPIIKCTE